MICVFRFTCPMSNNYPNIFSISYPSLRLCSGVVWFGVEDWYMSAVSAISLMLTPTHPLPTTTTNSLMTRCLCPVTNAPLSSCTLFTLCRGKQRPCQSLSADRDGSSACVGGDGCQTPAQIRGESRSVWKQNRDCSSNADSDEQSTSTTPASNPTATWCRFWTKSDALFHR